MGTQRVKETEIAGEVARKNKAKVDRTAWNAVDSNIDLLPSKQTVGTGDMSFRRRKAQPSHIFSEEYVRPESVQPLARFRLRLPAWHACHQAFKLPFVKGFRFSSYLVTSKSGLLQTNRIT